MDYEERLDSLIEDFFNHKAELMDLAEFCYDLPVTEECKALLLQAIVCYDFEEFYETLFGRFRDLLSEEEKELCRRRYSLAFDGELEDDDWDFGTETEI